MWAQQLIEFITTPSYWPLKWQAICQVSLNRRVIALHDRAGGGISQTTPEEGEGSTPGVSLCFFLYFQPKMMSHFVVCCNSSPLKKIAEYGWQCRFNPNVPSVSALVLEIIACNNDRKFMHERILHRISQIMSKSGKQYWTVRKRNSLLSFSARFLLYL